MMEGEGRGFFDASVYMLFEASGDSDQAGGYFDGALLVAGSGAAEDDAQSCSYGSSVLPDICEHPPPHLVGGGGENRPEFDDYCNAIRENWAMKEEETWRGDYEEEEGVVDQSFGGRKALPPPEAKSVVAPVKNKEKVKKSNKACEELMNERERDKLFWEACLAS